MAEHHRRLGTKELLLAGCVAVSLSAYGDPTDIASAPLATASNTSIKPNILFILDDSGSMDWEYLPDDVGSKKSGRCFKNHLYNRIYFNPDYTYEPPIKADGTSFPNASFSGALKDGFNSSSGVVNLDTSFQAHSGDSKQQAYYYKLTGSGVKDGQCGKDSNYTKESISSGSALAQNFANWYSYYRKRVLMMRTASSMAFKEIDADFRVGFSTITEKDAEDSKLFLSVRDFNATQKADFYDRLFSAPPVGWTPLRGALSKAGRYFANTIGGQTDPVQYSCQQNFAILSTDGYWNNNDESYSFGPKKLSNDNVGNQDAGSTPRPMLDDYKNYGKTGGAGVSNSLADVAMYYYKTDLRDEGLGNCTGALGANVCENNVPGAGKDVAVHQHMTTFTLGLGVDGTLDYTEDYETQSAGDFFEIIQGTRPWPDPINNTGGERIDDLWHAAVNGRGYYYSAKTPDSLASGLSKALAGVMARKGSAAAAATSNLEPIAGDNQVFVAFYRTQKWDGDVQSFTIDPVSAEISEDAEWSAQEKLDGQAAATSDDRTIYFYDKSGLQSFTYANLKSKNKHGHFDNMCSPTAKLSQCSSLSVGDQGLVSGANLVNYLRGQSGYEDQVGNLSPLYRDREHVLGDIVNSAPVYVKDPPFEYSEDKNPGYSQFAKDNKERDATLYVAANDGMLHAFDTETGKERWAYVPTAVLGNMYRLADKNYANNHIFLADGSPVVGDVMFGNQWRTILVGGLNAGGRSYYALDITNPAAPKALWEYSNDDDDGLGYTFGNPIITKNADGQWVVIFASGHNNGDGEGHLFVLDAETGKRLDKLSTKAGTPGTPSGLSKINAWVDSPKDNTAKRIYGGDLLGNVWRFDYDDQIQPAGKEAVVLAQLKVGSTPQPITVKPELVEFNKDGEYRKVVLIGTGRYLGTSDLKDMSQQSIYALKDELQPTGLGDVRSSGKLVKQTLKDGTGSKGEAIRTSSNNPVNWAEDDGWYVDLNPGGSSPGERVNVDMQQQFNILWVAANVPESNACNIGGYAWLYSLDIYSGARLKSATDSAAGIRLSGNAMVAGIKTVMIGGKPANIITDTSGKIKIEAAPPPTTEEWTKRTSWRELTD